MKNGFGYFCRNKSFVNGFTYVAVAGMRRSNTSPIRAKTDFKIRDLRIVKRKLSVRLYRSVYKRKMLGILKLI